MALHAIAICSLFLFMVGVEVNFFPKCSDSFSNTLLQCWWHPLQWLSGRRGHQLLAACTLEVACKLENERQAVPTQPSCAPKHWWLCSPSTSLPPTPLRQSCWRQHPSSDILCSTWGTCIKFSSQRHSLVKGVLILDKFSGDYTALYILHISMSGGGLFFGLGIGVFLHKTGWLRIYQNRHVVLFYALAFLGVCYMLSSENFFTDKRADAIIKLLCPNPDHLLSVHLLCLVPLNLRKWHSLSILLHCMGNGPYH